MKRLTNIYPINICGREIFVSFDHFTNGGQAVYNVETIATSGTHLIRYSGVKANNQDDAARRVYSELLKGDK